MSKLYTLLERIITKLNKAVIMDDNNKISVDQLPESVVRLSADQMTQLETLLAGMETETEAEA